MNSIKTYILTPFLFAAALLPAATAQSTGDVRIIPVEKGWAQSSVNTVIFRQNSITTHGDIQFTAYYNAEGQVVLARRNLGSEQWVIQPTPYSADVNDAHNSISLGVDGDGYLHLSWGMHGNELLYARSLHPHGLELSELRPMTGKHEQAVTYPQFFRLDSGDLLFMYRDGSSGRGDVMLNRYRSKQQKWVALQHPLISGEGERNAYVNPLAVDDAGRWHLSWTWRETWDVSTNHDIMYAYSPDEGKTWVKSTGERYKLPVTADNAEVVKTIPQGSELINQTSMTVNSKGEPVIASYWKPAGAAAPQFHIVWQDGGLWNTRQVSRRSLDFSLSGGGTKRIPISRPKILAGTENELYLVYRDFERGGGISVAVSQDRDYRSWAVRDIYTSDMGLWEPTYDPIVWRQKNELHLFGQRVGQGDGETLEEIDPQTVFILEWAP